MVVLKEALGKTLVVQTRMMVVQRKVKLIESRYLLEECQGAFGMDWRWKKKGGRGWSLWRKQLSR